MASCNPYESTCGLTGTEYWFNPYLPDSELFSQYIVVNFDTGERTIVDESYLEAIKYKPQVEDELILIPTVRYYEHNPVAVNEPPLVGLILVAYLLHWIVRR